MDGEFLDVNGVISIETSCEKKSHQLTNARRVFWNFKTEGSPEWDAFRLIDNGIFPQPLTDRKFSQICT